MQNATKQWEWEIGPKTRFSFSQLKAVFDYRHLLSAMVKKEFILNYRQTILGPVWLLFQPVLTLIVYVFVFGKLMGVSTSVSIPPVLFYFSGIVLWNFFSDSFASISNTFRDHIYLYSKVYFPRLILPLSILSTNFLRFIIQLALLLILLVYYVMFQQYTVKIGPQLLYLPLAFLGIALISLGIGLVAALLTAKYRDIANLIGIMLRLLMFVTPVLYSLATVNNQFKWIILINPLTPLFELFRYSLFGEGTIGPNHLIYSFCFSVLIISVSLFLFTTRSSKLIDVS